MTVHEFARINEWLRPYSCIRDPFVDGCLAQEADRLTREVEAVDRAIDSLVYELY